MANRQLLHRRTFLKLFSVSLFSGLFSGCTHKKFFNPDEDIVLSGGSFNQYEKLQNALIIINLTQKEKRVIETAFLPHDIIIDPNDKYRVYCFEKNGSNACEIDLQSLNVIRNFSSESNQLFSGHATFSQDGKNIICIESNTDDLQGIISIRDRVTLAVSKTLPTLGLLPHECFLTEDNALLVSNTGKSDSGFHQPSIVSIDLNTEKLIERIKLDKKNLNCGHFKLDKKNRLVVASAPADISDSSLTGGVSIRLQQDDVITMSEPKMVIDRMTGEALGIDINQQNNIVAITHPEADLLTFWSLVDKKLVKAYGIEKPRGICQTLDQQFLIISYGNKPAMAKVATSDLTPLADSIVQPTHASGEHIINWSSSLREIMPKRVYD